MTPKEKALKLCQTFGMTTLFHPDCNDGITLPLSVTKKCALIAVEIVCDELCNYYNDDVVNRSEDAWLLRKIEYWQQVKTEIENL